MLSLQTATIVLLCVTSLLVGYTIGNFIGWLQAKKQNTQNSAPIEIHNNIYYGDRKEEQQTCESEGEDGKVVIQNSSSPHRPSPLHGASKHVFNPKKTQKP